MPIHPDEQFRVVGVRDAVADAVSAILGEALLGRDGLQARRGHRQFHVDADVAVSHEIVPQRGRGFVHAALAFHQGRLNVTQIAHLVRGVAGRYRELLTRMKQTHCAGLCARRIAQRSCVLETGERIIPIQFGYIVALML